MSTLQRGPWYTAYSSSYDGSRTVFCGICATCFIFLGVFLTFGGAIMTGFAFRDPSPPFDDPFFTGNYDRYNHLKYTGPVLLSIGLTLIIVSSVLCCVISTRASRSRRQEGRVLQDNNQIHSEYTNQPPLNYPQQPQVAPSTTSSYYYQYNVTAPYYPSPGNISDQPPSYDSLGGAQPYNSNLVQVASSAYVVPTVADAHPYPVRETK